MRAGPIARGNPQSRHGILSHMKPIDMRFPRLVSNWRLIIVIYLALFLPLFRPVVSVVDPVGYYSWSRSLLIDGDLNVADEFAHYGMDGGVPTTPTGYLHNQWAAGSSLIWLPGMMAAHAAVTLSARLGAPVAADGYSWPYAWAASLTSTITGLGAVLLSYLLARKLFGVFPSLLSAIAVWLASPLVFYQYHQPLMSHANDAWLWALFVLVWWDARQHNYRPTSMLGLGLVIGAAVWVRTQNLLLLFVVLVETGFDLVSGARHSGWKISTRHALKRVAPLSVGFASLFVPLALFWHTVYGVWIVNTYQATGGGTFDWHAGHLLEVLFSTDRGLLVWMPIAFLCIIGVKWLFQADRRLTLVLSGAALLHLYVVSSWSWWFGGAAFGPRFWIVLTPFFTLGLAAFVNHLDHTVHVPRLALIGLSSLFVVWNFLLMLQYSLGLVASSGPVDLGAMIKNQFIVAPQILERVLMRLSRVRIPSMLTDGRPAVT